MPAIVGSNLSGEVDHHVDQLHDPGRGPDHLAHRRRRPTSATSPTRGCSSAPRAPTPSPSRRWPTCCGRWSSRSCAPGAPAGAGGGRADEGGGAVPGRRARHLQRQQRRHPGDLQRQVDAPTTAPDYKAINYGDPSDPNNPTPAARYAAAVADVVAFQPHVIFVFGSLEFCGHGQGDRGHVAGGGRRTARSGWWSRGSPHVFANDIGTNESWARRVLRRAALRRQVHRRLPRLRAGLPRHLSPAGLQRQRDRHAVVLRRRLRAGLRGGGQRRPARDRRQPGRRHPRPPDPTRPQGLRRLRPHLRGAQRAGQRRSGRPGGSHRHRSTSCPTATSPRPRRSSA